jgi:ABC-type nickel/cobalt efflux system permease component RcnA/ABC-type uncharacterized transport system substrate-binding protein
MKHLILFFLLTLSPLLHACATCALMVPMAEISIKTDTEANRLTTAHVTWKFSDIYTNELTAQYDKSANGVLDPDELQQIKQAKLDYLVPRQFLMKTELVHNDKSQNLAPTYQNVLLEVRKGLLYFSFDAALNKTAAHEDILSFDFTDPEGYFTFTITDFEMASDVLTSEPNLYLGTAHIMLFDPNKAAPVPSKAAESRETFTPVTEVLETAAPAEVLKEAPKLAEPTLLEQSIAKIKTLLNDIKSGESVTSYLLLLLFAFTYGVVHAMGPGHGKTLVSSYFLSNDRSYLKALQVSAMIGVVHTFSAFSLTLAVYFLVTGFLAQFMDETIYYTTKISALVIVFIAFYLFITKLRAQRKAKKRTGQFSFSATPHESSCACAACKVDERADLALILSAGMIPCPGTVTLFIFALSLELYMVGVLSAVVMSLGMSLVIFVAAVASVAIRKNGLQSRPRLKLALEYLSLAVIFVLGAMLLIL